MGCDIHMFAEKKVNGKWEKLGKVFKNRYYNPEQESKIDEDGYEYNAEFTDEPWEGRNYDLFAILADVRNGRGFAGTYTGEGFIPIAETKGIPLDASEEVKKEYEYWGCDAHSASWFTLKELKDYDWQQSTFTHGNTETYEVASGNFLQKITNALNPFTESDEDIRIVFWFDN